eukprot:TRINITY_DN556_c1_g1_i1.p1 TRINITY_DN556_c1_g1~~TRINITY_DN556_c1_g1_i1.p1  ORF type:complete len:103 (-),score=11.75 TRINITY_DN556_c1_g1_i1:146-454(-)
MNLCQASTKHTISTDQIPQLLINYHTINLLGYQTSNHEDITPSVEISTYPSRYQPIDEAKPNHQDIKLSMEYQSVHGVSICPSSSQPLVKMLANLPSHQPLF